MPDVPGTPRVPRGGTRAQRAADLKAEMEAKAAAPEQKTGAQFHQVQEGETLESIAGRYGQSSEAIWDHPLNTQLRERLGTPDALGRGDRIYIPGAEQEQEQSGGPVGQGDYIVKDGDCISSIAKDTGHLWETIWNEPANSELKEVRKDPNVLLPEDRVTIPNLRPKQESGETEMRHRFVRRGEPAKLRLHLLEGPGMIHGNEDEQQVGLDQPLRSIPYCLTADGQRFEGTSDADGWLECPIPGNARRGMLVLHPGSDEEQEFNIVLGSVSPISELCGVRQRLSNLGFQCGSGTKEDALTPELKHALEAFQRQNELPETSEPDEATRLKLVEIHGS